MGIAGGIGEVDTMFWEGIHIQDTISNEQVAYPCILYIYMHTLSPSINIYIYTYIHMCIHLYVFMFYRYVYVRV